MNIKRLNAEIEKRFKKLSEGDYKARFKSICGRHNAIQYADTGFTMAATFKTEEDAKHSAIELENDKFFSNVRCKPKDDKWMTIAEFASVDGKRLSLEVEKRLGSEIRCPVCRDNLGKPGEFWGRGPTRPCYNCGLILKKDTSDGWHKDMPISTGEYVGDKKKNGDK